MRTAPLAEITGSSYVKGRLEAWYERGSNLQSIPAGRARIFTATPAWDRLRNLGNLYLPGWHSMLVCGGQTSIDWHRDHGHFEGDGLMLNLGEAEFWTQSDPRDVSTQQRILLTDGMVVRIQIKVLHRSVQRSPERFHVTWRKIRPAFLSQEAPLPLLDPLKEN
jgi:hypothetical protein